MEAIYIENMKEDFNYIIPADDELRHLFALRLTVNCEILGINGAGLLMRDGLLRGALGGAERSTSLIPALVMSKVITRSGHGPLIRVPALTTAATSRT